MSFSLQATPVLARLLKLANSWTAIQTFINTGLHILDTNASHDLILKPGSDLTADRTLTLTTGDADRTLTMADAATISGTNTGDVTLAGTPDYITIANQVITRAKLDPADDLNTFASSVLATLVTDETGSGALVFGTAPTLAGGAHTALTGLGIRSTGTGAFDMTIANAENLAAGRTLTIQLGDAARTLILGASPSLSGTNTGDQTITLTGDVTGSGVGSFAATVAGTHSGSAHHTQSHDHSAAGDGQALAPTTIAASTTTDATSPTAGAVKTAGGLAVAKKIIAGGDITIQAANTQVAAQNPTNPGVQSVGGHQASGNILDNQSFTVTMQSMAGLVVVYDSDGACAAFLLSYLSATIVELADPSARWSVTDVDGNPGWAIFKSANSHAFTIKNYMNATKTLRLNILGTVESATAPA